MKKFVNITVIIMLMLATTGVSISKHYCHGTLISSAIFGKAKSCCDNSCNACRNESIFKKVTENYMGSSFEPIKASQLKLFIGLPLDFSLPIHNVGYYSTNIYTFLKAPPPIKQSSLPEYLEVFRC